MFQSCLIAVFAQSVANQNNRWQARFLVTLEQFEYQMMLVEQKGKHLKNAQINIVLVIFLKVRMILSNPKW